MYISRDPRRGGHRQVNDRRHSPQRKRRNSRSPPGNAAKLLKPNEEEGQLFVSQIDRANSNGRAMEEAPLVSPTKVTNIGTATRELSEHVAKEATARLKRDQAATRLERATAEYEATQKTFQQFPIIAEQKTTAKDKAQREYDRQEANLKSLLDEQPRLAGKLELAIGQILENRSRTDQYYVSRNELEDMRAALKRLEGEKVQTESRLIKEIEQGRLSRERFDKELESIKLTMRIREGEFKAHKSTLAEITTVIAEEKDKTAKLSASNDVVEKMHEMSKKLEENQVKLQKLTSFIGDINATSLDESCPMAQRLRTQSNVAANDSAASTIPSDIVARVSKLEELPKRVDELELLCDPDDQARRDEAIEQVVDEKLKSFATTEETSRSYDDLLRRIKAIVEETLPQSNREAAAALQSTHQSAITPLQAGFDRLKEQSQMHSQTVSVVQNQVQSILHDIKKLIANSPRNQDAPTRAPSIPNGNAVRQQSVTFDNAELEQIKGKIGALQTATNFLQKMYDNLTTDEVVRNMVDQMSRQYPYAKDAHEVASKVQKLQLEYEQLRQERTQAEEQLASNINMLQLRGESSAITVQELQQKVEGGATAIDTLETKMSRCEELIGENQAELVALTQKLDKTAQ